MKPRLTVITLGVDDLERALAFYRDGLGLHTDGIVGKEFDHGAVVFFDLQAGLKLALWPRQSLAHDSGLPRSRLAAPAVSLGHNVGSRIEADAVMAQAARFSAGEQEPEELAGRLGRLHTGHHVPLFASTSGPDPPVAGRLGRWCQEFDTVLVPDVPRKKSFPPSWESAGRARCARPLRVHPTPPWRSARAAQ